VPDEVQRWAPQQYTYDREGLVLPFTGKAGRYRMVLDSAATLSLLKPQRLAADEETGNCPIDLGPGRPCRNVALTLGAVPAATPVLMDLPDRFTPDGIVGREFFERFSVFVDLAGHVLRIQPSGAP
jgi:hypothetical protein